MSTMAMPSGAAAKSTLNPNAPLFIPAAFQQVEDFSPKWWELVKTTTWFRDHWFHQHQEQETFDGDDDEDVTNLLPESFDLGIADELSILEAEFEAAAYHQALGAEELVSGMQKKENPKPGFENDAEAVIRSLNLKSPKNGWVRPAVEPARIRAKPSQCMSLKRSPHRIIQQPR
ncbi:protein EARLY RESPONSIVE TO DEHYDRATION 15-like [Phoenix dactylifera]|uniref:Protein EARLY RESPONSIVE TO DEHYDRATION 15-like n=1 Tax=Phoenix dactylifera TaxID=42345 RepID=A0A8B7CJG2_PHODC|nr:protein EARLY RESPONSIVE TO DEHYDRATION 15-like [Phoenix dactylifera]